MKNEEKKLTKKSIHVKGKSAPAPSNAYDNAIELSTEIQKALIEDVLELKNKYSHILELEEEISKTMEDKKIKEEKGLSRAKDAIESLRERMKGLKGYDTSKQVPMDEIKDKDQGSSILLEEFRQSLAYCLDLQNECYESDKDQYNMLSQLVTEVSDVYGMTGDNKKELKKKNKKRKEEIEETNKTLNKHISELVTVTSSTKSKKSKDLDNILTGTFYEEMKDADMSEESIDNYKRILESNISLNIPGKTKLRYRTRNDEGKRVKRPVTKKLLDTPGQKYDNMFAKVKGDFTDAKIFVMFYDVKGIFDEVERFPVPIIPKSIKKDGDYTEFELGEFYVPSEKMDPTNWGVLVSYDNLKINKKEIN